MPRKGENIYYRKDGRFEGRFICGKKPDVKPKFLYAYGKTRREVRKKLKKAIRDHFSGAKSQAQRKYEYRTQTWRGMRASHI